MGSSLDLLAEFTLDVWLAAKFSPQTASVGHDGRTWERIVAGMLYRPGFTRRQGPGNHTLFGILSASGVEHEIDGAADGWRGSVIVECKATEGGITKADAALFHVKVMDFYQRKVPSASREKWWRILCGTTTTAMPARATAMSLGLLICDPGRLPLPVLVRAAGRPAADLHLPEPLPQEIVRPPVIIRKASPAPAPVPPVKRVKTAAKKRDKIVGNEIFTSRFPRVVFSETVASMPFLCHSSCHENHH